MLKDTHIKFQQCGHCDVKSVTLKYILQERERNHKRWASYLLLHCHVQTEHNSIG